jgi:hypothetical protein
MTSAKGRRRAVTCHRNRHDWVEHEHQTRDGSGATRVCSQCNRTAVKLPDDRGTHQPAHAAVLVNSAA